jgi:uncharacterized membrane protein HdeD (DUF308 family)
MNKAFTSFLLKAGILAILLSSISHLYLLKITNDFLPSQFHFLNLFVFGVTALVHYFLTKQAENRVQKFINSYMLSITAKLFIFFISIVAYAFTHKSEAKVFIVSFFILYLLYTALEVVEILKVLKQKEKQG